MRPELSAALIAAGNSTVLPILCKVTLTTILGFVAAGLARRSRAAVRHAILAAAFWLLLAVPVASLIAPPISIAVSVPSRSGGAPSPTASHRDGIPSQTMSAAADVAASLRSVASMTDLLFATWLAGVAIFMLPVAIGLRQIGTLRRSAVPWTYGQEIADRLAAGAGVHRRVEVLMHEALAGPMTCGAAHPAIMLPENAGNWQADELDRALVHELEHVKRCDWTSQCVARAICALYWFHPLVWMVWRRLGLEAERACDDAVLHGSEATAYADQLVGIAQRLSKRAKLPLPAMASRADLAKRVRAVLDARQRRGPLGASGAAVACVLAVLLAVIVSPLRMVAAAQPATASAQDEAVRTFQASTALVIVDVNVADSQGRSVSGLRAADFMVTEDGVPQKISVFEYQETPGHYILGYYTANLNPDGNFRQIRVTIKELSGLQLDYRMGYYGPQSPVGGEQATGNAAGNGSGPVVLHKVAPEYSEEARKAKYQGTVLLDVEVDPTGRVTGAHVDRSLGLGLDEEAIKAVRQWRFRPEMQDGHPVASKARVAALFLLF